MGLFTNWLPHGDHLTTCMATLIFSTVKLLLWAASAQGGSIYSINENNTRILTKKKISKVMFGIGCILIKFGYMALTLYVQAKMN